MKLLVSIIVLSLLFSCSEKKKVENSDKNIQSKETNINPDGLNDDAKLKNEDNLRKRIQKTVVADVNEIKGEKKAYNDSIVSASKQVTQKQDEIPPDGEYIYSIAYDEWQGRSMGEKVLVVISGNSIQIISEGNPSMTAKKGEVLDEGILVKHNESGDWLITDNPLHADLEAYGGCVGIATVIDFINKKYHTC